MMYYVYRFLDSNNKILYIGKTNNLKNRINQHFNNGHLEKWQYEMVHAVEYLEFKNESDQHICEIYLINKYKPPFNVSDKKDDTLQLKLKLEEKWVNYMYFKGGKTIEQIIHDKLEKINKLKEEILMLRNEFKITNILDILCEMIENGKLIEGVDYKFVNNYSEFAIYSPSVYDKVQSYNKTYKNIQEFQLDLKNLKLFKSYKPVKMLDKVKKCYVLDNTIKKRGDIPCQK